MGQVVKTKHSKHGTTHDALDGVVLQAGEVVLIQWPDGTKASYPVFIDHRHKEKDHLAYVIAAFKGTTNRVYLRWKHTTDVTRAGIAMPPPVPPVVEPPVTDVPPSRPPVITPFTPLG